MDPKDFITRVNKKRFVLSLLNPLYFVCRCKVAFLNTDNLSFTNETINGNSFHNEGESKIIKLVKITL